MVSIERVDNGQFLRVGPSSILYGSPTKNGTLAAALLRKTKRDGDATYYRKPSAAFGVEVYILDEVKR